MAEVEQRGRQSTPPFYPCHILKLQRSCVHKRSCVGVLFAVTVIVFMCLEADYSSTFSAMAFQVIVL